jgi:hypothetical protein
MFAVTEYNGSSSFRRVGKYLPNYELLIPGDCRIRENLESHNIQSLNFTFCWRMHHVMILAKWPTWRTSLFYVLILIFNSLHVSSILCSSSGEISCVNTSSGNCHSVSVAVSYFRPAHDMATDIEWQLPEVVLTQFVSPDDEHDVLETCRELKIKINT